MLETGVLRCGVTETSSTRVHKPGGCPREGEGIHLATYVVRSCPLGCHCCSLGVPDFTKGILHPYSDAIRLERWGLRGGHMVGDSTR